MWLLTTNWDSIALKDAHWVSQNEVTKELIAYTDGAGKNGFSEISNCKIYQDPVQWVSEFLELCRGHQDETVGEDGSDDHNKHPECCKVVNPSRGNVVVGTFKGIWGKKKQQSEIKLSTCLSWNLQFMSYSVLINEITWMSNVNQMGYTCINTCLYQKHLVLGIQQAIL